MNRSGHLNLSTSCSSYFQCYPAISARIDLLDDGPDAATQSPIPRWPRGLRVMGALAEGATGILCVERAGDGAEVAVPIPYLAVGQYLDLACRALLTDAVTAVRLNGEAPLPTEDALFLSLTGTPDANYELAVEIQSTGGLNAGTFRWSLDGGATWEEEGVTIPADGTHTAGTTGMTIVFADETFTDDDLYEAETFVTDVTNVLVQY